MNLYHYSYGLNVMLSVILLCVLYNYNIVIDMQKYNVNTFKYLYNMLYINVLYVVEMFYCVNKPPLCQLACVAAQKLICLICWVAKS